MALNIQGNIELKSGVVINSAYARVNPRLTTEGDKVRTTTEYWISEQDYLDKKYPIDFPYIGASTLDYDRTTDGSDLLSFSNEAIKSQLEAQGFSVVITEL